MKSYTAAAALVLLACWAMQFGGSHGWGGLFNRFSPEVLANLGYGGHGGHRGGQPAFMQVKSHSFCDNFLINSII